MVRILITVVVASLIGAALGTLQFSVATSGYTEHFEGTDTTAAEQLGEFNSTESAGTPKIEVDGGTSYDFGSMLHGETMSREFVVRNIGTGPLVLEKAGSTCKCTVGNMNKNVLQPNEETVVTLTWTAQSIVPMFGQSATFKTNDPAMAEVKFSVSGQIASSFVLEPSQLALGDLPVTESSERTFYVFSYLEGAKELKDFEWTKEQTGELVSIDTETVPVSETPYHERHKSALVAHKITIKFAPGMPLGPLNAKIRFNTDHDDKVGGLEIPVMGRVISDISLLGGPSFDSNMSLLSIGNVNSQEGASIGLTLAVQGEARHTLEPEIASWEPREAMNVTLGEPKIVGERKLYSIHIEVPKGAPEVSYPGTGSGTYGKIVIKTNHETMQELPIYIRLVVVK